MQPTERLALEEPVVDLGIPAHQRIQGLDSALLEELEGAVVGVESLDGRARLGGMGGLDPDGEVFEGDLGSLHVYSLGGCPGRDLLPELAHASRNPGVAVVEQARVRCGGPRRWLRVRRWLRARPW